jgi:cytochrome oxidase assembly protein ShyY1
MRQDSPYSVDARTSPYSAQVIQYGFSEKWLIVLCIIIAALGLIFGVSLGTWALVRSSDAVSQAQALQGEIRAYTAAMDAQAQTTRAKLEIVQYDHNALKAQLVAKGIYEATEH